MALSGRTALQGNMTLQNEIVMLFRHAGKQGTHFQVQQTPTGGRERQSPVPWPTGIHG